MRIRALAVAVLTLVSTAACEKKYYITEPTPAPQVQEEKLPALSPVPAGGETSFQIFLPITDPSEGAPQTFLDSSPDVSVTWRYVGQSLDPVTRVPAWIVLFGIKVAGTVPAGTVESFTITVSNQPNKIFTQKVQILPKG